jgi:hypothetical protein
MDNKVAGPSHPTLPNPLNLLTVLPRQTALENIKSMVGMSAPPEFLTQLTYLAWNHHPEIVCIDTVRAYTFGPNFFVEVDVVLPEARLQGLGFWV